MSDIFTMPSSLADAALNHARAAAPREACGFLVGPAGLGPQRLVQMANMHEEPEAHYRMLYEEVVAVFGEMDSAGEDHFAVYHSHPLSPEAVPSQDDVGGAEDLSVPHLIIAPKAKLPIRAWMIEDTDEGRHAREISIRQMADADAQATMLGYLQQDNVVTVTYASNNGTARVLTRARVAKRHGEVVVLLEDRRQVPISLDRVVAVQLVAESFTSSVKRGFAVKLLKEAADQVEAGRIGAARGAVEAACRAAPGLMPRMRERPPS